jgi:hypothetical protein
MEPRDYTDDDFIDFDANELTVDEGMVSRGTFLMHGFQQQNWPEGTV